MEIISDTFSIYTTDILLSENIKAIGINVININGDNRIIFRYKLNEKYYYIQYTPHKKILQYIFFEIINNSLLWNITYNLNNENDRYIVTYVININSEYIKDNINKSQALYYVILDIYLKIPSFISPNLTNKSIIPNLTYNLQPTNFNIVLYNYQLVTLCKMMLIEKNNIIHNINYTTNININNTNLIFDPITYNIVDTHLELNVSTKGGIIADEMGLGKTISCIALISENLLNNINNLNYLKYSNIINYNKIKSKATLIFCPSHLIKQWKNEITKCNNKLKVILITSKIDFIKVKFNDIINTDIILISYQFIMNFKYYPNLYNIYINNKIETQLLSSTPMTYNIGDRNNKIKTFLTNIIPKLNFNDISNLDIPLFEYFYFNRIIVDECHEFFALNLTNYSLGQYMSNWMCNIDSNYYWYVSGTPFLNFNSIINCAKFINLKLEIPNTNIIYDYSYKSINYSNLCIDLLNKTYIWNNILDKICIRHLKNDIKNQVELFGYEEELIWIKFTELERELYNSKINKVNNKYLQQLCCHPLIVESSKKIFGNIEIDLLLMQDKLISYHKNNYDKYKEKLEKLDSRKTEYYILKKSYENQMNESKYLYTILEKINSDTINLENCAICMDEIINPTLTSCGHLYCYECLRQCFNLKKICPICKNDLTGTDIMIVNKQKNNDNNSLIEKYGSKLGKLISIINYLLIQPDNRIIIFSQWDDMLTLIGKTLIDNKINNSFVKGNVWYRNSAISKFKNNQDNKIIMLSLKNAASGTTLTEATHIIFIEPINASKEEINIIESQALARACRIGQKQKIKLIRILIKDTIEEDIYNKYYT